MKRNKEEMEREGEIGIPGSPTDYLQRNQMMATVTILCNKGDAPKAREEASNNERSQEIAR